ncbi:MAG TPA: HAD hydrolase family protein [Phycisphaerales bacterium]|nr:HAD hydrolase family protein [Phycisphaerales bacterium]
MSVPATVTLLILDVDGVMTDGSIVYDDRGGETKAFNVRDGFGVKLWIEAGGRCAIITRRGGEAVRRRAAELGIDPVIEGAGDKGDAVREVCRRTGTPPDRAAYLADDWPDLAAMRAVAYPMAVADADPRVRERARFVTRARGGRGAVRDAVEHLLEARDALTHHFRRYDGAET